MEEFTVQAIAHVIVFGGFGLLFWCVASMIGSLFK